MQSLIQQLRALFARPPITTLGSISPPEAELPAAPRIEMRRYPVRRFVEQPPREILHGIDVADVQAQRGLHRGNQ